MQKYTYKITSGVDRFGYVIYRDKKVIQKGNGFGSKTFAKLEVLDFFHNLIEENDFKHLILI